MDSLARARELGCHPWELFFGRDSIEAELIRTIPGLPIYEYEYPAKGIRKELKEVKEKAMERAKAALLKKDIYCEGFAIYDFKEE